MDRIVYSLGINSDDRKDFEATVNVSLEDNDNYETTI